MAEQPSESKVPSVTPATPTHAPVARAPTQQKQSTPYLQLKRGLQMMSFDEQAALLAPSPVQMSGGNTDQVHAAAAQGIASGGGAMPHGQQIQSAFGNHDISGIQAHTGDGAKQANQAMGAEAYATGNHIAFGGAPDLHTAAHEAAHVVQQGHGVSLSGGVGSVGDTYENHADKVADAVVKGESAEPILNEMTGGGAKGGTQQKAIQQKAVQLEAVQRVVPPVTPPLAPVPTPWEAHVAGLPDDIKTKCTAVSDTPTQTILMAMAASQKRIYFTLGVAARGYYASKPDNRSGIDAMAATATHLAFFEANIGNPVISDAFFRFTPNERADILKIPDPAKQTAIMSDPTKMAQWNATRVAQEPNLASNPALAAALIDSAGNPLPDMLAICSGEAGERLRRIASDPGFASPATPVSFVADLRAKLLLAGAKSAWDEMKGLRPAYVKRGIATPISDAKVPDLCKAIPIINVISFNTPSSGLIQRIMAANTARPDYPKDPATSANLTDPLAAYAALGRSKGTFAEAYLIGGGAFALSDMGALTGVTITGGGGVAYWTADASVGIAALKAYTLAELRQKLAIEESAAYNSGAIVVNLKKTVTTLLAGAAPEVFRPTAIDGLEFTQFDIADPGKFHGVTSGGTGEVMIPACTFADVDPANITIRR